MNTILYKQWYKSKSQPSTPVLNVKHLRYIATRKGVVHNLGCGFGLWGRINDGTPIARNINNLQEAQATIYQVSKFHTIYRAVVSLDETTALYKNMIKRGQWELLIQSQMQSIAVQNDIDYKDLRWCCSFHAEKGHPHMHLMFWDNSGKVREEYTSPKRFEIATEKIRSGFNRELFRDELKELRQTQDNIKKLINDTVMFYPKTLKQQTAHRFAKNLTNLLTHFPYRGQLKYQYMSRNNKQYLDTMSEILLSATNLVKPYHQYLRAAGEVAHIYGNGEAEVEIQMERARQKIYNSVGNDILQVIQEENLLYTFRDEIKEEKYLQSAFRVQIHNRIRTILENKKQSPIFLTQWQNLKAEFPNVITPKSEVLKNPYLTERLDRLIMDILEDPSVQSLFIEYPELDQKELYKFLHREIYRDMTWREQGTWRKFSAYYYTTAFIQAFCELSSNTPQSLGEQIGLVKRNLSKQAKKEYYLKQKDSSLTWGEN